MTRTLLVLLCAGLLLTACGRKNPPEIPEGAGEAWVLPYPEEYGGGYEVDSDDAIVVDVPPPAYFPGAEAGAARGSGVLTFPMPNR